MLTVIDVDSPSVIEETSFTTFTEPIVGKSSLKRLSVIFGVRAVPVAPSAPTWITPKVKIIVSEGSTSKSSIV